MTTRRYLSVEMEISGTEDEKTENTDCACRRHGVESVGDRSLNGTNTFELNTPPAKGDAFAELLDDVCGALKADGAKVNTSCGLHVHVDARDLDHHAIARLIRTYARIEDALFSVVAPSRRSNDYCERCGPEMLRRLESCQTIRHDPDYLIARAVYDTSNSDAVKQAKREKYHDKRYAALNLHSWVYRGTVECRLHQGSFDADRIRNWAHLWGCIIDFAKDGDPDSLPDDSWDALMAIAPTDEVRDWLKARRAKFSS